MRPAIWLALAAGLLAGCGAPGPAPLLLYNAKVFTADTAAPWAEAILIRGERIEAVGSSDSLTGLADNATRVDLEGATVVPGFNDAHVHVAPGLAPLTVIVDPNPVADPPFALVADSLKAVVGRTPPGTPLLVSVGERVLSDSGARRAALDVIAPGHPVQLAAWSGHGLVLNSVALAQLGLDDSVADPLGGYYERDGEGVLTGLLHEYAVFDAYTRQANRSDSAARAALVTYAETVIPWGVTSIQVMATAMVPEVVGRMTGGFSMPIDTRMIRFPLTGATGRKVTPWYVVGTGGGAGSNLRVSGIKYILDGTPVERLAALRAPYADQPGWFGRLNFPPDTLRAMLSEIAAGTDQPLFHAVGDSTISLLFRTMEAVAPDSVWRRLRPRIEHGEGLAPDLFDAALRLGVVLVQNPSHFTLGPMVPARMGPDRVASYQPLKSALRHGIPVALGSDGPANPFLNLMLAVLHPGNPAEALTMEEAVTAFTAGSAFAEHREQEKGRLAPGLVADLTVLSQDIFTVPIQRLMATTSHVTIKAGRVLHDPADRVARAAAAP